MSLINLLRTPNGDVEWAIEYPLTYNEDTARKEEIK